MLKEFKREYPLLKSNTKLNFRITNLDLSLKKRLLNFRKLSKINDLQHEYNSGVGIIRRIIPPFYKFKDAVSCLKSNLEKYPYANCGEMAMLTKNKFEELGEKAFIVSITPSRQGSTNKYKFTNHAVTIIGANPNAKIENPKTWGNKAVMVDAWSGVATKADEGLRKIKEIFNFNPRIQKIDIKESSRNYN